MSASVFSWPVRVYYEDTDAAGVVYYANYLRFAERARTEWVRSRGIEQDELARSSQVVFVVRALAAEYLRPARFNDTLVITVDSPRVEGVRLIVAQRVLREAELLFSAQITLVCVTTRTFRTTRIPPVIAQRLCAAAEEAQ